MSPSVKPTLPEMKSYVFAHIPTADNSQQPIFPLDITTGQLDSDDDDSTEYDKASSDDDYSIDYTSTQRLREKYSIKPVLHFSNATHLLPQITTDHWLPKSPSEHLQHPTTIPVGTHQSAC